MVTARDFVFQLLRRWTAIGEPPFLPERSDETFQTLSPRDRPFAFDLLTGIIRWRGALDAVMASRLRQPLETLDHPVRAILWLGAYQLLLQGGTADYAAVDTTVELAKKHRETAKASGMVNAVLRGITRLNPQTGPRKPGVAGLSRRALAVDFASQVTFSEDIFLNPGSNPLGHLAAVRSHPAAFVEHLRNLYGEAQTAELLLRNNLRPVVTFRVDADAVDIPAAAGLTAHAAAPRFLVATEGWNPHIEELVSRGVLSPQDPTAAKPVQKLAEMVRRRELPSPATILDLCAGLGTKSLQLARAFPAAKVTATDIDSVKLARLQDRAAKVGAANLLAIPAPAASAIGNPLGESSAVLVDVPCSNTGVMGKRVQSRWRWPSLDRAGLHRLQHQLLAQGMSQLAPQGALIYSTCSIDPAENQQAVQRLVAEQTQPCRVAFEEATLPSLDNGNPHDGGYFAVILKQG